MTTLFAVIVGSGFAGLNMAIALKRKGIHDFVVLEKADSVGGTWRDNVYPGCACDVPSHVYSFSFEPNPNWSATYSPQPEIRKYVERCFDKYNVRHHVQLNTEAQSAVFDSGLGVWKVKTDKGETITTRFLVGGLGPLHRYTLPDIPGISTFGGALFHSAHWDRSLDPAGKRVISVGTGASAIQFIPELAKVAAKLHVFQRTPAWVLPRRERHYSAFEKGLLERAPWAQSLVHKAMFWTQEAKGYGFVRNPALLAFAERFAKRHLEKSIADPALRKKLTPNYSMGCKRILMSNTYYPALAQPNVEVITDGIREITPEGAIAGDGVLRPADAIVFGTGFDVHDYLGKLRLIGKNGRDLGAEWAEHGAQAYLGVAVEGFPNLFMIVGPNTGLGHNSMIYMIEAQVEHILACMLRVREKPGALIEVRKAVQDKYNRDLQQRLSASVWASGCASWYLDAQGRNTTLWPGFCFQFRQATRSNNSDNYSVVSVGA